MNRFVGIALAGFYLMAAGCASQAPSDSGKEAAAKPVSGDSAAVAPASVEASEDASMPAIPEGAQFTLHCSTFVGPTHIGDARRSKESLIRATGSKDWYVIHSAQQSDLYYGFYKTFDDRSQVAEFTRAQSDRAKVSSLVDGNGDKLFTEVGFGPIDTPDPPAPKEWELSSNPGFWTLQIAVYKGSAERKKMAVDAVRGFREHGIEAYFRHGAGTSEVYIGSWPRNAVAEQDDSVAQSNDPNEPLLVLPGPMPGIPENSNFYDSEGRKMKVVMPKLQIVDPSLRKATEDYPNYYVNGEVIGRKMQLPDHSWKTVAWPSYLIQVPHDDGGGDDSQPKTDAGDNGGGAPADSGGAGAGPAVPGLGGLR